MNSHAEPSNQMPPETEKPLLANPTGSGLPANVIAHDNQTTVNSVHGEGHLATSESALQMQGTWFDIWLGFSIVTLPMLIFNIILIVLVAVLREPNSSETLSSERAIHVNINATTFTTITSWASTLSTVLGGFIILLGSYHSSHKLATACKTGDTNNMPTPYQFAMMLDIKAGSVWRTIWRVIFYRTAYRKKRAKLAAPVWFLIAMLFLSVAMSLLVAATDTWLHLATEPVNILRYIPSTGTNLSVALIDRCLQNNNSRTAQFNWYFDGDPETEIMPACTLNPSASRDNLITEGSIPAMEVLNNASTIVLPKYHAVDDTAYFYLSPADTEVNLRQDYTATSFAMSTTCIPKSVECGLRIGTGPGMPYNCSAANFNGEMGDPRTFQHGIRLDYYRDPSFQESTMWGVDGTFYFYVAANLYREWSYPEDPEVPPHPHGDHAIILGCKTSVYDVLYRVQNETIVEWGTTLSNATATNGLAGPVMWSMVHLPATRMAFSFTGSVGTAAEFASNWAAEYSRIALSLGTFALRATPALDAQIRESAIVSRVPIAPLAALLIANLLYCVLGVVLTAQAVRAARQGPETKELVERAGTQSVVAALFEDMAVSTGPVKNVDDMFTELTQGRRHKVGVGRIPGGGYSYILCG
ncbi:hypothetical protein MMYC01_200583 [Madurella mycetomatis]|uniref:Uncharacterized protein n=1 Tax=Madurella mycetomatis TaxID=100816 RepID=A0A175WJ26_9PEZI|nr:hypothetical protein MMYC01_200583 [Madurella mycetomatis]